MMFQRIKEVTASRTGILCIAALTAVCTGLTAWGMLVSADDTTEINLGDLNGDHSVDAADAAKLLIAAAAVGTGNASGLTETQEVAADLNGDAAFDAVDASQILNYAAYVGSGGTASLESFLIGETTQPTEEINENGEVVETIVTEVATVPVEEIITEVATEVVNTEAPAPVVTEATTVRSEETTVKTTTAPKMTTEAPKTTKATTVATTKATTQATTRATTAATTRATTVATTVATTAAPVQNPINADSYYGTPWTAKEMGGVVGIVWTSSTHVVVCDIKIGYVETDYEIPSAYYNDFMYVYNNELSYGQTYDTAINQASKYVAKIQQVGRDNVLYTNDIEDDGVVRPTWGVWWTLDGEYWVTA